MARASRCSSCIGATLRSTANNPTLLTGYGGFNVSRTPMFDAALALWLDAGGLYALPNLRGGGEYGEAWHRAGMLEHKQNVFDDFIAAAEWLIERGYTQPRAAGHQRRQQRWAAGRRGADPAARPVSRGGVPGAVARHAALSEVADCALVGCRSTAARRTPSSSPGSTPIRRTTTCSRRAIPGHVSADRRGRQPRRSDARAQDGRARCRPRPASSARSCCASRPHAGHGQGKPRSKQVDEAADIWSFLFWQLGVRPAHQVFHPVPRRKMRIRQSPMLYAHNSF